jgi:hypothetical protein
MPTLAIARFSFNPPLGRSHGGRGAPVDRAVGFRSTWAAGYRAPDARFQHGGCRPPTNGGRYSDHTPLRIDHIPLGGRSLSSPTRRHAFNGKGSSAQQRIGDDLVRTRLMIAPASLRSRSPFGPPSPGPVGPLLTSAPSGACWPRSPAPGTKLSRANPGSADALAGLSGLSPVEYLRRRRRSATPTQSPA